MAVCFSCGACYVICALGFSRHMEAYLQGRRERVRHHKVVRAGVKVVRFCRVPSVLSFFYLATSKGNED